MATYLHAREADAYARLLAKRRRPKNAAPSFRFEPRAMPTIEERPPMIGLPPPGLRYTLYAPRRAEPAVDEQAAAAAEARRRAAAAAAEEAAIRRYLAKQATAPRAPAPVPADAAARRGRREDARNLHQLMCAVDEEHAALARQSFPRGRAGQPAQADPLPVGAGPIDPPVARQPGAAGAVRAPETPREGRPAGPKKERRRRVRRSSRRPLLPRRDASPQDASRVARLVTTSSKVVFYPLPVVIIFQTYRRVDFSASKGVRSRSHSERDVSGP